MTLLTFTGKFDKDGQMTIQLPPGADVNTDAIFVVEVRPPNAVELMRMPKAERNRWLDLMSQQAEALYRENPELLEDLETGEFYDYEDYDVEDKSDAG